MYTRLKSLGKHLIQTNPFKFEERLFSEIYLCRLRWKQGREIQDFLFRGREFQRDLTCLKLATRNMFVSS